MSLTYLWYLQNTVREHGYPDKDQVRLWPKDQPNGPITASQYFFTGTAVILNAIGGHAIMIEMIDAMVGLFTISCRLQLTDATKTSESHGCMRWCVWVPVALWASPTTCRQSLPC
jgi:hypothetical protein